MPLDVGRGLQEVLEDLELALADRCAERGRLEVGQVEHERLRLADRGRRGAGDRVRICRRRHRLRRCRVSATLRPDRLRCAGREVADERPVGRVVLEHHQLVTAALDVAGRVADRREREDVVAAARLERVRRCDDTRDEVALDHHRRLRLRREHVRDRGREVGLQRARRAARHVARLPRIDPIVFSAFTTDASVHLILCVDSALYFATPACRR